MASTGSTVRLEDVREWGQQIEAIAQLPKAQQRFVSQMLDTVLTQAQR